MGPHRPRAGLPAALTRAPSLPLALLGALPLIAVLAWNAWVSDDAYITFRVADNLLHGHGLRWNVDERVQAYSNPLWLLVFTPVYAIVGDAWAAALLLGVGCTLAAVVLARRWTPTTAGYLALVAGAMGSKALVDYGTSGLENPLGSLLLVAFVMRAEAVTATTGRAPATRRVASLSALAALLLVHRLDASLLVAPTMLALPWLTARAVSPGGPSAPALRPWLVGGLLGATPLLLWLAFATAYYGDPLPNTAAAKLQSGWQTGDLALQGVRYLLDSLRRDPITLVTVAAGLGATVWRPTRLRLALAAGVALHLLYVVKIGGDFMSGRFLTAPLVLAALLLVQTRPADAGTDASTDAEAADPGRLRLPPVWPRLVWALPLLGVLNPDGPLANPPYAAGRIDLEQAVARYRTPDDHGICDERAFYYPTTALALATQLPRVPDHPWRAVAERARAQAARRPAPTGRVARVHGVMPSVGFAGFFAGPEVHLIDSYALVDPFLAAMPPVRPGQRIGHIERVLPEGYVQSRADDRDLLRDPALHGLYADVELRTRAALTAPGRASAIVRHLLGRGPAHGRGGAAP
ncbi:MAG: hypothetical protein RIT45_3488 [Pseudomonadota bacterium]